MSTSAFTHSHRQVFPQFAWDVGRSILVCGHRQVRIESRLGAAYLAALWSTSVQQTALIFEGKRVGKSSSDFLIREKLDWHPGVVGASAGANRGCHRS